MPLISVIIPTYNYGHYLLSALRSVSEQSFTDWECIVIDDGSTDNTRALVTRFIGLYPEQKFRYIQIQNSGTSAAKNYGLDLASGKYIQFLDADDLLSKDKLALQFAIIDAADCALVFSKSLFFKDGYDEQESSPYPQGFLAAESLTNFKLYAALVKNNVLTISSPLVHKDLIISAGKFPVALKNNEDWLVWFKVALLKPIFIFDKDAQSFTKIRIHSKSAMKSHHNMFLGEVVVRKKIDAVLLRQTGIPFKEVLIALNKDMLALHRVRSLEWISGWKYILCEFTRHPVQRAPLFARGLFRSFARVVRQIVPQHGA